MLAGNPAAFAALAVGPVADGQATISYTPALDWNGPVQLTVTADDGQAANNLTQVSFTLTLAPVNDAPSARDPIGMDGGGGMRDMGVGGGSVGGGGPMGP